MVKHAVILLFGVTVFFMSRASDTNTSYSAWVQQAATISIYSECGIFFTKVPINQKTTLTDVKNYLREICITHNSVPYALKPLHNQGCWCSGGWSYCRDELTSGKIKDHMEKYDTDSFWIQIKPRKAHQH